MEEGVITGPLSLQSAEWVLDDGLANLVFSTQVSLFCTRVMLG